MTFMYPVGDGNGDGYGYGEFCYIYSSVDGWGDGGMSRASGGLPELTSKSVLAQALQKCYCHLVMSRRDDISAMKRNLLCNMHFLSQCPIVAATTTKSNWSCC